MNSLLFVYLGGLAIVLMLSISALVAGKHKSK